MSKRGEEEADYWETYKHAAGERHGDWWKKLVGGRRLGREARHYRYYRRYRCSGDFMRGDEVSAALGADEE